jgi:hypothetical protein
MVENLVHRSIKATLVMIQSVNVSVFFAAGDAAL